MRPVIWRAAGAAPAFRLAPGATVEVTGAQASVAAPLCDALSARGYAVRQVERPSGTADAVLITEGLVAGDRAACHWAALQAAKVARREDAVIILLQQTSPYTGLEGLSRTLRKEWPESGAYAWTITGASHSEIAAAVQRGFPDGVLAADGSLLAAEAGAAISPPLSLATQPGVWLVTGGARGVTAACAIELARTAGGTILLAGRSAETPWPDDLRVSDDLKTLRGLLVERSRQTGERVTPAQIDQTARSLLAGAEIRETLAAIRSTGAYAEYVPLDAGNAAAVSGQLSQLQHTHGPITGWVHGAGVLADRLAADKTEAELRRVFSPKVDGLENILAALDVRQLRHIAFFSSAAAFFGNKGQSDYAMANALLASAGRWLAAAYPSARVKAFHWGPWAGGMVDGTLASHFEAQGIPLIPISEGARIFVNELLGGDPGQIELVVGEAWATA